MAWPISLVYGLVVHVRNLLYDHHIFKSETFNTPTICVGNLSTGGTGKTPMIEFLISRLGHEKNLAILSRGYKRKSQGYQFATEASTVEQLGDEPFQIHRKYPKISLAVDSDRRNGIARLEENVAPDLILLDDAFQHRRVKPQFSLLLTTYAAPFFKDWYLPTGNLRDSKHAAKRADCIVVTKCPKDIGKVEMEMFKNRFGNTPGQIVLFSSLSYDDVLHKCDGELPLQSLKEKEFTLVTGIANPDPLVAYLKKNNFVFEHLRFSDHHTFNSSEVDMLKKKSILVTTEKDFARLQDKIENIHFLKVEHQFLENGEKILLEAIDAKIKLYR